MKTILLNIVVGAGIVALVYWLIDWYAAVVIGVIIIWAVTKRAWHLRRRAPYQTETVGTESVRKSGGTRPH